MNPEIDFLQLNQVLAKLNITKATLYVWMKKGVFPRPVKFSSKNVKWIAVDVDAWIMKKINEAR